MENIANRILYEVNYDAAVNIFNSQQRFASRRYFVVYEIEHKQCGNNGKKMSNVHQKS